MWNNNYLFKDVNGELFSWQKLTTLFIKTQERHTHDSSVDKCICFDKATAMNR